MISIWRIKYRFGTEHLPNFYIKLEILEKSRTVFHMAESVADFIRKLYRMVSEEESINLLKWYEEGNSFIITDTLEFSKLVLPAHFKHSNFQSFIRQLNKYGFNKVKNNVQTLDNKVTICYNL